MIKFTTQRLIVKDVEEEDLRCLHRMYTKEDNMRYVSSGKYDWTLEEIKEKYSYINKYPESVIGLLGVIEKNTNSLIGEAGFFNSFDDLSIIELGYILDSSVWGKGYGAELCEGMIKYCFSWIGVNEVIARMHAANIGSMRVCEKNGMQQVESGIKEGRSFYKYAIYR